uniref:Uncharacterized protein n=1 Tax=Anguilla anguilla TaxID=7936 RepID=A0A0E9V9A8_ANGAN
MLVLAYAFIIFLLLVESLLYISPLVPLGGR